MASLHPFLAIKLYFELFCSNLLLPFVKVKHPPSSNTIVSKVALIVSFVSLKLKTPAVAFVAADTHSTCCSPFI